MSSPIIRQTLLWLAGLILPATPLLRQKMVYAVRGVGCAIAGSIILSGVFIALLCGLYVYIVSRGIEPVVAFAGMTGVALVAGAALLLMASRYLRAVASLKDELKLMSRHRLPDDPFSALAAQLLEAPLAMAGKTGSGLREIGAAFIDGLMNGRVGEAEASRPEPAPEPSSDPVDIHAYRRNAKGAAATPEPVAAREEMSAFL